MRVLLSARRRRSPPLRLVEAKPGRLATVSTVATLSAKEPATPTLSEPAPDLATAVKRCSAGPLPPAGPVTASSVRPSAVMLPPEPMRASLVTVPRLIATATPTPALPPVATAEPSALLLATRLSVARTVTVSAALMARLAPVVARAVLCARLTATAPATAIALEPDWLCESVLAVSALGLAPAVLLSRAPRLAAAESALPRWPWAWLSTPLRSPPPSSCLPPLALALAVAVLDCWALAVTATDPAVAVVLRSSKAVVVSVTTPTATDAPIAALVPVALPVALVAALPAWLAPTVTEPAALKAPVPDTSALVSKLATVTAATGTTATPLEPLACTPPSAVVSNVFLLAAVTPRLPPLVSAAPLSTQARAVSSTTCTATDAPTPTLWPPLPACGLAVAWSLLADWARTLVAPAPLLASTAPAPTWASVRSVATLIASEPATPMLPPLAPEVAAAEKVCTALALGISAATVMPWAFSVVALPMLARLNTSATLMATAAPTLVPPLGDTAVPSARLATSVSAVALTVAAPPAVIARPLPMAALVRELPMPMPTAPATLTDDEPLAPPSLSAVLACGVAPAAPLLRPPLPAAWLSPALRCAPACWSTPPFCVPSSCLPPLALALAVELLACRLLAVTASAPPSVAGRSSSARVVSTIEAKASEMPTPTLLPWAAPSAVVVAVPAWSALTVKLCAFSVCAALRSSASVSVVAMVIAAAGVIAVPPADPPLTEVATVLLEVASSVTAPAAAPASRAPVSASVRDVASDTLIATEAPTPTALLPASTLDTALAESVVVACDFSDSAVAPVSVRLAVGVSSTSALVTPALIANAPATPTLAPPAPAVAWAPNCALLSVASAATPPGAASVVAPENCTRLAKLLVLIAAATPMPTPPDWVLVPSASVITPPAGPARLAPALIASAPADVNVPPVDTSTSLSPVTLLKATAAASCSEPSLVLAPCCCSFCVPVLGVPPLVAPPCVDLAWVSTLRTALADSVSVAPLSDAVSAMAVRVAPPSTVPATVPPTAEPLDEPAPPSALVVAETVLLLATVSAPAAVSRALPPTVTLASLLSTASAIEASLSLWVLLLSGWVSVVALTVELARNVSAPALVVICVPPPTVMPALDVVCTIATLIRLLA